MNSILRTAAVQSAAARQLEGGSRVNISGIAAVTGIPRGEVSRLLRSGGSPTAGTTEHQQNVMSRILSAWHRDARYVTAGRRPRSLKIFGEGLTFESLVGIYGHGIPVRAVLDELTRVGAIQLLTPSQKVFPKMSLPINPHLTQRKIGDIDATVDQLFSRYPIPPDSTIVQKVSAAKFWSGPFPLVRRKIGPNAMALQRDLQKKLVTKAAKLRPRDERRSAELSVTIVYTEAGARLAKKFLKGRRNFHRKAERRISDSSASGSVRSVRKKRQVL